VLQDDGVTGHDHGLRDADDPRPQVEATLPRGRRVAAVDVDAAHGLDGGIVACGGVHVLAGRGRREDGGADLELGKGPGAGIGVLARRRHEDRVRRGAVDAVAVRVDEREVREVRRPGADGRIGRRTVLRIVDPIARRDRCGSAEGSAAPAAGAWLRPGVRVGAPPCARVARKACAAAWFRARSDTRPAAVRR
jgi:hypothetical protein